MSSLSIEARVGVFVVAAVVLLAGFVLALGNFRVSSGFRLFADFAYCGNLQEGAPVKVSGVRVGQVRRMALLGLSPQPPAAASVPALGQSEPPLVRAELRLDQNVKPLLTEGTQVAVGLQGIIGEAYLELAPGKAGGRPLTEDTVLRGVDAPELQRLALEAGALIDALGAFVHGESSAGASVSSLLSTLSSILSGHGDELGRALSDVSAAAADLRAILAQARATLAQHSLSTLLGDASGAAETLKRELPPLFAQAQQTLGRLEALSAAAQKATDNGALTSIVSDAREAAHNLAQLSRDGRALMSRVVHGKGSVGAFLNDPQVYNDVKEMVSDLKRHPWKLLWRD
jgi:phospholipid/cholesterol/gamma-HCH transport system substrate-binding protein